MGAKACERCGYQHGAKPPQRFTATVVAAGEMLGGVGVTVSAGKTQCHIVLRSAEVEALWGRHGALKPRVEGARVLVEEQAGGEVRLVEVLGRPTPEECREAVIEAACEDFEMDAVALIVRWAPRGERSAYSAPLRLNRESPCAKVLLAEGRKVDDLRGMVCVFSREGVGPGQRSRLFEVRPA